MLTRIEIDGFKSFEQFTLDLQPFSVIAGPNAAGKSNLFDSLRVLSKLATEDVTSALRDIRGQPSELFRKRGDGTIADKMQFAVELLLDPAAEDTFGERVELNHTRIRYEVELERRRDDSGGPERVFVSREEAMPIKRTGDRLFFGRQISNDFSHKFIKYSNRSTKFLETKESKFRALQDGVQGRPRLFSAQKAGATVLSRITTVEFRHLFALRQQLAGITFLQLDPAAAREPSDAIAPEELMPSGANLATVLARIEADTKSERRPKGDLVQVRNALATLVPGVKDLSVERDKAARRYEVHLTTTDGVDFTSRVLSDGTLRLLTLLTFLNDPRRRGVLLFEEPENGVHEARLVQLIEALRGSCSDPSDDASLPPLFQVLVATHSPIVMRSTRDSEIIAADTVLGIGPGVSPTVRRTRMRTGVAEQGELDIDDREHKLTRFEVDRLLRRDPDFAA
jgi:predicted ATPase